MAPPPKVDLFEDAPAAAAVAIIDNHKPIDNGEAGFQKAIKRARDMGSSVMDAIDAVAPGLAASLGPRKKRGKMLFAPSTRPRIEEVIDDDYFHDTKPNLMLRDFDEEGP